MAQRPPPARLPVEKASARAVKAANISQQNNYPNCCLCYSCFSLQLGSDSGMGITHPTGHAEPAAGQRPAPVEGLGTARPSCLNSRPVLGRDTLTKTWVSVSRYRALGLQMCSVYII